MRAKINKFLVANLLQHIKSVDDVANFKIAKLLMRAGRKALSLLAFEKAFHYLEAGSNFLV